MDEDNFGDNKGDEIINVKLPRKQYDRLRKMIDRDEAMGWLEVRWKTHWVWAVGGGLLALFLLWDKIHAFVTKV